MAQSTLPQTFIATEAFAFETGRHEDGTPVMRIVHHGDRVYAGDPILEKGRKEQFFRPLDAFDK